MRKFRKSKSDKPEIKTHHISIPQKDPTAILPPKKVIRALFDFNPDPIQIPGALQFSQGDFLHVVGREEDTEWYEACNPVLGTRGLVPVNHFEDIAKTTRNSASYGPVGRGQSFGGHDSGYAERATERDSSISSATGTSRLSKSMGRQTGAMVYGVVLYDFKAERGDELEAKAGENVIVIAQSNSEWFVAKPITRLGGPGLIPVSFVEVRDLTTGKAVSDANEAVARAGVPKVEEWKKMAAEYKSSSIPLGRIEPNMANGVNSLQRGMERMSVGSNTRQSQDLNGSNARNRLQQQQQNGNYGSGPLPGHYAHPRASQSICPLRAKVPRYTHLNDEYWFIVEAVMEDGKYWELVRHYKDFYALQCNLMDKFPEVSGKVEGIRRTLPLMPGPLPWVTERITSERRAHLDTYLRTLLTISPDITSSQDVRAFFTAREGDKMMDSESDNDGFRLSAGSQQSGSYIISPQTSNVSLSAGGTQRLSQQGTNPHGGYHNSSDLRIPNGNAGVPSVRSNQGLMAPPQLTTAASFASLSNGPGASTTTTTKIKVWFADANCVVIRMPVSFTYVELLAKLRDRWALEPGAGGGADAAQRPLAMEYKDEETKQYWRLTNDEELADARGRNEKLTLRVGLADRMV